MKEVSRCPRHPPTTFPGRSRASSPSTPPAPPGERVFSLHERSGYGGIVVAFVLVTLVETTVVHLLLPPHHPAVAAALLALGVYSLLWVVGDYQAIRGRPWTFDGDQLTIRLGLRKQLRVRRDVLRSLESLPGGEEPLVTSGYARCTPLGAPELLLRFHRPARLEEMYRPPRDVSCLGVTLDDEAGFRAAVRL